MDLESCALGRSRPPAPPMCCHSIGVPQPRSEFGHLVAFGSYVHSYPDKVSFKDRKNLPPVITSGPESEKKNRATPGRSAFMLLQ